MHTNFPIAPPKNIFESMVHIGDLIKQKVKEKHLTVAEFAKKINTNRNNVYDIFNRQSIDTAFLFTISTVLTYNFFEHYNPLNANIPTAPSTPDNTITQEWLQQKLNELYQKLTEQLANACKHNP